MSSIYGKTRDRLPSSKKKTAQGTGKYTKRSHSGGETFHAGARAGSPPTKAHCRKKPRRGQGR